jgi:tRNA/tmRNA/rRNA uracil-C5-methylase (TrmA/RlmC/RlmD family)
MLTPGGLIDLRVEKPAAGGRMIARHEGQIVLVMGAIPGERVTARIERVEKRLAFASVAEVLEASPDRREPAGEPACGGCLYAHINYSRQVPLKSDVIADAFIRIGRIPLPSPPAVAPSPERGYRMRARLHVAGGRPGFLREGTHQLCDAGPTGQLHASAIDAVNAALAALGPAATAVVSIELSENLAADERAFHLELAAGETISEALLASAVAAAGLTGCSARAAGGAFAMAGDPAVTDALPALTNGRAAPGVLRRHAASFFQANRFLLVDLVEAVMDAVPAGGDVLDLYAGVGLFAVSLAAAGRDRLFAVEGDRESGADLLRNAAPFAGRLEAVVGRVEDHIRRRTGTGAVIVDPPRTGMSKEALEAIVRVAARRLIYVSCDPPTMARDARRLLDAGYRLASLRGFDLFPNTPHVEAMGTFESSTAEG